LPELASAGQIFLTVLNPGDDRKNIDLLLRSFVYHAQRNDKAVLLVKLLTNPSRFTCEELITGPVRDRLVGGSDLCCSRILLFNDYLEDSEMSALYQLADYYLSLSIAEGQNLPLLEAMAEGVIPVSTQNTAMGEYINEDNSVPIVASERITLPNLGGSIAMREFQIEAVKLRAAVEALSRAAELSVEQRRGKFAAAVNSATQFSGTDIVLARIEDRLSLRLASQHEGL